METKKEIIIHILENPIRLRESYIINNFIEFHNKIIEFNVLNLLPEDISFKEKLWYYINDIKIERRCFICHGKVNFNKKFANGYKNYCSTKCTQQSPETKENRKRTCNKRYGVDNVAKLEENKEKAANTNILLYGHKSSFQNKKVREKWRSNIQKKYDVEHIFQLDWVKDKSKKTSLNKYGVEHYVQSEEYKKRLEDSGHSDNMKKIYNDKIIKTNLERYGVEHYILSDDFKSKKEKFLDYNNIKDINNLPSKITKFKETSSIKKIERYKKEGISYIYDIGDFVLLVDNKCGHNFIINKQVYRKRLELSLTICTECNKLHSNSSHMEDEVFEFIKNVSSVHIVKQGDRSILGKLELDILIEDLSLAFEFNGLYWHCEINKPTNYHYNKTNLCKSNGINLIHIWEDDWLHKKEIIKSIITNKLGLINDKIYARKCIVKILDTKEAKDFINSNHIQGYSNSNVKLGLYHNNILVSSMTFGNRFINGKRENELITFCSLLNTNVVGGASKLFKYYINNYDFNIIKSYADVSMFDGSIYEKLGFNYIHRSEPNYYWVVNGIRKHRFNYNKKKLIQYGYDKNKTEVEIMHERGYYRIWGCGQDLYIFKKLK